MGATTFPLTMLNLASNSYRKLGMLPSGGVPTNDQMNQAILDYNLMVTGLEADGMNLFRREQLAVSVAAMQGYPGNPITITPLILNFTDPRWVVTPPPQLYERLLSSDYPYSWYMNLPNKLQATTSGPSLAIFDKQSTASNIYIWPLTMQPGILNCTVARPVSTVSSPTDTLDFPIEWFETITYMLADRLMEDEGLADAAGGQATAQRITQHAIALYAKLINFDRPTSVFIRPYGRAGSGPFWRS